MREICESCLGISYAWYRCNNCGAFICWRSSCAVTLVNPVGEYLKYEDVVRRVYRWCSDCLERD